MASDSKIVSMRWIPGRARWPLLAAPAVAFALLAGCGDDEVDTPAACLEPADVYVEELRSAPDPVLLDGSTPISECLVDDQSPADVSRVGEEMIDAATQLNTVARRDPSSAETVQLGYLIGAAQEGASPDIHTDLLRRLDAAARFSEGGRPPPASFERTFGEGYAAGQDSG
jgi:hypothetical protein